MPLYNGGTSFRIGFLSAQGLSTADDIFHIFSIVIVLT
jgi:hypothetical protein